MRRKYFGLAIAAFATLGPMQAWGGDREIAEQIISRLKSNRDSGALKDFTLDMKVDKGVVLFRGNVSQASQHDLVLQAAEGIEGITQIVDEVSIAGQPTEPQVVKPSAPLAVIEQTSAQEPIESIAAEVAEIPVAEVKIAEVQVAELPVAEEGIAEFEVAPAGGDFSFSEALATQSETVQTPGEQPPVLPGHVQPVTAAEPNNDAEIVSAVVSALTDAKNSGLLRGFGVDVKSHNGVLQLTGRASSAAQRDTIIQIAENVPGVSGLREAIAIPTASPNLPLLPEPPALRDVSPGMTPVAVDPVPHAARNGVPANVASSAVGLPVMTSPYRTNSPAAAMPVSTGAPVAGQPVPMAPYTPVGAPRYDSPNLPNYAWPGYAAHPNYAALTYPQQYSPSAWPYIGPFYPYPQVPLGWRKVSLEWDDGWWFLDFTDR